MFNRHVHNWSTDISHASTGDILFDDASDIHSNTSVVMREENFRRSRAYGFAPLLFAVSVFSAPFVAPDSLRELRRSGAASIWSYRVQQVRRISLQEARLLALKLLSDTNDRLRMERISEFQIFLTLDEDVPLPT